MPMYDYTCSACECQFSDVVKISERDKATEEPCPECDAVCSISRAVGSPMIVSTTGGVYSKTPDGFRDLLKNIKQQNPRSTIEV